MKPPKKFYLLTLAILSLVILFFHPAYSMQQATIPEKFVLHVVKPGDTIWQLSKAHMPAVDPRRGIMEIRKVNGMDDGYIIQPGDVLNIPSEQGTLTEPLGPEYSTAEAAEETDAAGHQAMEEARELQLPSRGGDRELTFEATAYTQRDEEGTADGITFSGTYVRRGVVAVDPDTIPLGSWLYIESDYPFVSGYYRAEDVGGAIKGRKVDIYMKDLSRAMDFGRREVKVVIIDGSITKTN